MVRACKGQVRGCKFKFNSGQLSLWNEKALAQAIFTAGVSTGSFVVATEI